MVDVATAVEAAEAVTQVAAPAVTVSSGALDPKKVALGAGIVIGVSIGTYFCVRALKKRKENKAILEAAKTDAPMPVVDPQLDEVAE